MTCEDFVRSEQSRLWEQLGNDIRQAVNGVWSMAAADCARRIAWAARLVGPTPWGETNWSLVAGGVYEAVLRAGGVEPLLPADEDEWARTEVLMAAHGGTRATAGARLAATVAVINTDRERRWISGEGE